MQAVAARQQVQRHGLAVQPRHLLSRGLQRQQGAVDLDPAVDERLPGLEDEQVLELRTPGGDRLVGREQRLPPHPRGQPAHLRPYVERLLERAAGQRHVADRREGDDAAVEGETHLGGVGCRVPGLADREAFGELRGVHGDAHSSSVSGCRARSAAVMPAKAFSSVGTALIRLRV